MLWEEQDAREHASQLRQCAGRLREMASTITGGRISRDYVEELALDFDRCAEALEFRAAATVPPPE